MRILAPSIGPAVLGNDGAELFIRQHIHPRGGCDLFGGRGDHVFVAIWREAAQAIVQNQLALRRARARATRRIGAIIPRGLQARYAQLAQRTSAELLSQGAAAVV